MSTAVTATPKASNPRHALNSSRLRHPSASNPQEMARSEGSRLSANSGHSSELRSNSIPVTKYIHRTPSELQLYEEEVIADFRDYCMYSRIVGGIIRQQMGQQVDLALRYQNDEILANVMRTRYSVDTCPNSSSDGIHHSSDQVRGDDDWAVDFCELHSHDEGIFVLEL